MEKIEDSESSKMFSRRNVLTGFAAVGISVALVASSCGGEAAQSDSSGYLSDQEAIHGQESMLVSQQIGDSLIAMHEDANSGWRFKSAIQAPHYQTDRDVGASGIGMGFLVLADRYPEEVKWQQTAEQTANWLISVAQKDSNGRMYWPDYADDDEQSDSAYTSFDDGTLGISDFFWQLYERTQNESYRAVAESSLAWTLAQAENVGSTDRPAYRWLWDKSDESSGYQMGMGMGVVGIVHALAEYHQRLQASNPALAAQSKQYMDGAVRYISSVRSELGNNNGDARALPETGLIGQDGDTNMNSGYLSGTAGAAFMYLKLYKVFNDRQYLEQAERSLSWLADEKSGPMVRVDDDKVAWKLSLDPQGGDDDQLATGFEEGAAGIAWVFLQAYKVTGQQQYLETAKQAANWLSSVAQPNAGGVTWHEDEAPRNPIVHANLNNGAAGIGMFLLELNEASGDNRYKELADQARVWIANTAQREGNLVFWDDNDGEANYSRDPSWHWGSAGIIAFMVRAEGGKVNIPGMQAGL